MPLATSLTTWNLEPLQLVPTLLAAILYARRCRTLASRGTPVPLTRRVSFWLGIGLVIAALNSPIDSYGDHDLFLMHMLQHVIIGDLAPLAFVFGLTGPVLRPVLAIEWINRLRFLTHPFIALPIWAIDLYVWHIPYLYEAALHHSAIHALEHTMFFSAGCLMWSPVVETLPAPAWFGTGAKLGYIVAVRLLETVLGNVFIWSNSAFYSTYNHPIHTWGISPVRDQNFGGVVMMAEGGAITLAALAWLFLRMFEEGEQRQRLIEQGVDPAVAKRAVRFRRADDLEPPPGTRGDPAV